MSYIDVAIPGIAGFFALAFPYAFLRKPADPGKIRRVRLAGAVLLVVAALYLAIRLAGL
jgi:hypothetical protein